MTIFEEILNLLSGSPELHAYLLARPEQLRTTDDHVMEIIGTFMKGKQRFYVCRNSWGKNWGNKGLIYLSEDYLRLKTIAVSMSEEAYLYDRPGR